MKLNLGKEFTAIFDGMRYRFRASEHTNVGDAWGCLLLPGQNMLPRVVVSTDLTDMEEA